jgi:hypothetical protein
MKTTPQMAGSSELKQLLSALARVDATHHLAWAIDALGGPLQKLDRLP